MGSSDDAAKSRDASTKGNAKYTVARVERLVHKR
jgi:hypothetical protein